MQIKQSTIAICLSLLLAACGGGGGGGDNSSSTNTDSSGSTNSSSGGSFTSADNVHPIQVTDGPVGKYTNGLFTTVTVCQPGTNICQSIDNILVDTGSYGLRLMSSVSQLSLPQQANSQGAPLLECAQFMSGYTWGTVRLADIQMAGEKASSVPVQIIGDMAYPDVPASCDNTGKSLTDVSSFGVNGVLGIGTLQGDCPSCTTKATVGAYYTCSSTLAESCTPISVPASLQVQNPVFLFQTNNNGVILYMPSISDTGGLNTQGSLVFGIGTQSNNGLNNATVITTDDHGFFSTTYKGKTFTKAFLDSGSNGLFFNDSTLSTCSGWYCPTSTQNLSATHISQSNVSNVINFNIANSRALFLTGNNAFNNLGGTMGNSNNFDWGLPFYYGRTVYTAFKDKSTPAGMGPYVAY